jgi:hypothetical protein
VGRGAGEHAAQLKDVMQQQLDRMEHLTTAALASSSRREGGTDQVYERSIDAMSRVAASRAAPAPVASVVAAGAGAAPRVACKNPECNAVLPPGTPFCGACGTSQ